ncbi:MAG: alpha/beta hydrolase [Oscillospiraceae bacterium]|nr:alpha/beta hydrolase [Oscillospiraceae bacterium]
MAKKKKGPVAQDHRTGATEQQVAQARQQTAEEQQQQEKISKRSRFLFWFTLVMLVVIFAGRWIWAIMQDYYRSFVTLGTSMSEAVDNMEGLTPTGDEGLLLRPDRDAWDLYKASRLADQVTVTADDGATLHAYYYDEGSDLTVVFVPRFAQDGRSDFLAGTWLGETTGCNLLLLDPRGHGESGGDYFSYGVYEQYDLVRWLEWAGENTTGRRFILWGEATGANTILFAADSGILPDSVAFAVAESPYAYIHDIAYRDIWKWYTLPSQPFLFAVERRLAHSDAGYTIQDTNLGAKLADSEQSLPVLFLTSAADEYILPAWSATVVDAYSGEKEWLTGGGSHGTVYSAAQESVQATLRDWIGDKLH